MDVRPLYHPVGELFKYQPVYRVPAYQRSYSWEQLEIEDFIRDLENCYNKRKYDKAVVHFFGQIVCIEEKLQGTYDLSYFELVDGQQRVATFILLVLSLKKTYESIIIEIQGEAEFINQKNILNERIQDLSKRYLFFQKEVLESFEEINVLELSNRDKVFFRAFIRNIEAPQQRESHRLIRQAFDMIHKKVNEITFSANLKDRLGNLKTIEQILENDFCILNMITGDRKAAFKLFQVLNNRGKNLTEGDLLRAESLRILEPFPANQGVVEEAWDNILSDTPILTERFLRAIYGSHTGSKASANSLFNEFLTHFIPEYDFEFIEPKNAEEIQVKVKNIETDIAILRKINHGQWPYEQKQPIEHWDRNRIHLLIHAFDHTACLPFLLSASLLDHKEFNKIIHVIERFVFRYLIVCNQYIGDLIMIYTEEAKVLRDNPQAYTAQNLIARLKPLIDRSDDEMFNRLLDDFKYQQTGGKSNKPLKYFLLTMEYYFRWYKDGANGEPTCMDKERVYDFGDSTIEHIYPNNAQGAVIDQTLEPLKNTIGNLTILGNADNRTGDNDDFETKRPIFKDSSLMMNREDVANTANWDNAAIELRTADLKKMALRIFTI
ncbi:DUF262 domain-containing protein [Mucilaginibacter xinganensis]|uniref:DUF262 domain-containing protein n=1 Tax=Mucilaginibacter xinganensis TaxID=1234841 RepID=A0A223NWK3_9SPHI|nr:DUF262 domain-containing protein [Mucilaginibacter xinganensis]ASU34247.1 hypothetical protein MuYL_2358 [Mucilaginibacter xinganensis]